MLGTIGNHCLKYCQSRSIFYDMGGSGMVGSVNKMKKNATVPALRFENGSFQR